MASSHQQLSLSRDSLNLPSEQQGTAQFPDSCEDNWYGGGQVGALRVGMIQVGTLQVVAIHVGMLQVGTIQVGDAAGGDIADWNNADENIALEDDTGGVLQAIREDTAGRDTAG